MNENAIHISHSTGRVKSCPEILVLQADRRQDKDVTQQQPGGNAYPRCEFLKPLPYTRTEHFSDTDLFPPCFSRVSRHAQ
jgi:hypothetical protein